MLVYFFELGVNHSESFSKHSEPLFLETIDHPLQLLLPFLDLLELLQPLAVVGVLCFVLDDDVEIAALQFAQLGRLVSDHA